MPLILAPLYTIEVGGNGEHICSAALYERFYSKIAEGGAHAESRDTLMKEHVLSFVVCLYP